MANPDAGNFFTKNAGMKLLSVFVALCLWFWVNIYSHRSIKCTISVPVDLYNVGDLDPGLAVESPRGKVRLTLAGRRLELMINLDKVRTWVDLGKARGRRGVVKLPIEPFVPGDMKVISIVPDEMQVEIVKRTSVSAGDSHSASAP